MRIKHLLKTTALTALLVIAGKVGWGQTVIHSNDCSSATAGWTFTNAGSQAIQQTGYWLLEDVGDAIVSQAFDVTGAPNVYLTFQVATYGNGTNHACKVEYSKDNGSTWETTTFTSATPTSSTYVTAGTFDLGAVNSSQLKFRWTSPSGGAKGVRIDNISISMTDIIKPTLSSTIPVDKATDVVINPNLTLTFSENIVKGTAGNITIKKVSDGSQVCLVDVTSSSVSISGSVATVLLPSILENDVDYYVNIDNTCFKDLSNNAFDGISDNSTWTFKTTATPVASMTLTSPNGGEKYYAGSTQTITWISANIAADATITIEVAPDGSTYQTLATSLNDGSEDVTIPANAIYANTYKIRVSGGGASDASNAAFTVIAVTDNLATLKAMTVGSVVKYTGKATVTFARNSATYYYQKYIQDENDAILIYDNNTATPYVATTYAVGDGITNVEGKIALYNSLIELVPQATTGEPATGNPTITPEVKTIASITAADQSKLVKLVNYTFTAPTGNFSSGTSYAVSQSGTDFLTTAFAFRASFAEADYITTPTLVPTTAITTVGIVGVYNAVKQFTPRFKADIKSAVATITSAGTYVVTDATSVISNVPYTVSVANFKSGLVFPANSTYNVFDADLTTPASVIDDTKKVIVTSEDGLFTRTYTITRNAASTDATLSNLTSGGTQVPSFFPETLSYSIELPFGTLATAIPTVVATKNNVNASTNITYATDLAGDAAARTTSILVTAEDGSTTKTYTIVYTIAAPKTDKTLSDLKFGTTTVDGFSPSVLAYSVVLPIGTTNPAPTVSATVNDATATVEITQAQNVDGTQIERTASVKVTAQDLSSQTYTVEFSVAIPGADATLSDLMIDGTTVAGFAALTTAYNVALPAGTSTVPTVTVTKNDVNATYQITPATNLAGTEAERTTTILVTAQNTTTTKTYTVVFRVKSANADLSDLTYDATTVPSFNATTLIYNVVLPHSHGTTSVPVVAATKIDANASVSITQAANLTGTEAERTATVVVTADDINYTKTYTIVFSVAKDTDAQLTAITYDGTAVSGFTPATLNYYVTLAFGTSTVPVVAATKSDENASTNIVQAQNLGGTSAERTATITVTAEDGIATKVYTVTFRVDNVAKELFFSEYIEGSSNNRAFEIFNPFSAPVDLSGYTVKCSYNGGGFGKRDGVDDSRYILTFAPGTMIAAGDVYLIYNSTAGTGISSVGDLSLEYSGTANVGNGSNIPSFTGNDALGLYKGTTLIDVFGGELVTANFDVAGVTEASVNHSIVRKPTVHKGNTTWSTSAGNNADNSEWIVNGIDVFTDLGKHTTNPTDPTLTVSTTTLADFGSIISGTVGRGEASFTVAGSLLSGDVTITAPAGFQISKSSGNDFVSEGPITLAQTSGTVAATTIYVKFSPLAVQAYSDFIIVSSQEITSKKVTVSGTGVATDGMPPSFTEGPSSINVEPYKFDVKFKVNEGGKVYIVKLASGSAEPSNTLVITDPSAVVVNVAPNTSYTQTFSGLTKNTAYDLYFVAGDNQASTNISGVTKLTVTTMDIPVVAIYDIQYTTDVAGNSPKMNTWVETTGIVTAVKGTSGFFMQSATGAWNGIYVYNTAPAVTAGDVVKVTGKIIETNKVTAFESTSVVVNQNSPTTVPEPVVVTTLAANNEQYEGVFVKVSHANCVSGSAGSYVVNDISGALTVYKGIYTGLTLTIGTKYNIQGVMDYYNSSSLWELYPRSEADVIDATGINDNPFSNLTVYPNPFSNEIRFDGAQNVKRVVVTSVTGQVVKNETVVGASVNTESLPQGMYLVTLINDKGAKTTLKMIKQ